MKNNCAVGFVCIIIFISSGCSGSNIFSTTYQNAVAYFNTYYNAKRTFDEALEETRKTQSTTLQTNLFLSANVSQTVRPKFYLVIEKCSKIIQFYPQSNVVDDALLLIGKSYYYLNEVVPAQRKFLELLENFPRSDLRFEVKLTLAKTYYLAEKENDALNLLKNLIAESLEEKERDIAIEGLMLEGQIFIDRNDYSRAIESYKHTLEISGDKKLLAHVAYQLAWCYESEGNVDAASQMYMRVLDFDPHFTLEYHARLRGAIMFSTAGNVSRALTLLEDLQSELLTPEQRSMVEFELGNTYQRAEDYQKALFHYSKVDSLYKRTDASAKSNYQGGIIFEKKFFDLQRANLYYDKAKNEYPQSEISPSAAKKSEILGRYVSYRSEFDKYDSLLQAYLHPEPVKDSDNHSADQDGFVHTDSLTTIPKNIDSSKAVSIPVDTIHYRRSTNQLALGILFFIDLDPAESGADSSAYWLMMMLHDYPDSKLAPQALYVLAEVHRSKQEQSKVDSLYDILLTKYPDSEYAMNVRKIRGQFITSSEADSAEILYANAMRLFDRGNTQQAIQELREVVRRYRSHAMSAKSRYAIGWIYENVIVNKDSAITHYRLLQQEQPSSIYSERIRPKLAFVDNKDSGQKPPGAAVEGGKLQDTTKQSIQQKLPGQQQDVKLQPPEKEPEPEFRKDEDDPDEE